MKLTSPGYKICCVCKCSVCLKNPNHDQITLLETLFFNRFQKIPGLPPLGVFYSRPWSHPEGPYEYKCYRYTIANLNTRFNTLRLSPLSAVTRVIKVAHFPHAKLLARILLTKSIFTVKYLLIIALYRI